MSRFGLLIAAAGLLGASASGANAAQPMAGAVDCFVDLMRGSSDEIVCTLPLYPNAAERADLEKHSRGYVKNAQCTVQIRIARSTVMAAVNTPDYEFISPAQPVDCEVTAHIRGESPSVLPISATFAPKITIKDGKAIDATPGLGGVTGVPRALSWPVETWINSGVGIKGNMLKVINAWLDHMRHTKPQKQAKR